MSDKKLRCYTCKMQVGGKSCSKDKIKGLLEVVFNSKRNSDVKMLGNGNEYLSYENTKGDIFSIEIIRKLKDFSSDINDYFQVEDRYYFFRLGRNKDIQDLVKRNRTTLLGEEILDEKEQRIYEIEVCTYILLDLQEGIIIEMYGQYAPRVSIFSRLVNENLDKILKNTDKNATFTYTKIVSEDMVKTFQEKGTRLNKIGYTNYSIPSANILNKLGFDVNQIKELEELGKLQIDLSIKVRPRVPLTTKREKISSIIDSFKNCGEDIKKSLFFDGSINGGGQQKFSFNEQDVTYSIPMTYNKKEGAVIVPLNLEEIESQAYLKMKDIYESSDVLKYI